MAAGWGEAKSWKHPSLREVSFCSWYELLGRLRTHQSSKNKWLWSVQHLLPPLPRLIRHCGRGLRKKVRATGWGEVLWNADFRRWCSTAFMSSQWLSFPAEDLCKTGPWTVEKLRRSHSSPRSSISFTRAALLSCHVPLNNPPSRLCKRSYLNSVDINVEMELIWKWKAQCEGGQNNERWIYGQNILCTCDLSINNVWRGLKGKVPN